VPENFAAPNADAIRVGRGQADTDVVAPWLVLCVRQMAFSGLRRDKA
jgi:hypothetical protein